MDEANFERNLSGFILSVLYAACSESEADTLSDQQTKTGETDKTTLKTNKEKEETASEEERAAFFRDVRSKELDRLTANKKGAVGEINTEKDKETAREEERAAFFRSKELDILTATMNKQSDEAENQNVQTEQKIINKESLLNQGETEALETEHTASEEEITAFFRDVRSKELSRLTATLNKQSDAAGNQDDITKPKITKKESAQNQSETKALEKEENASEEERLAFFQSVREVERQKLVEAFDREQIWKEESEKKRMRRKHEKIKKMFEEFHIPAVSAYPASYSSHEQEQEPGPFNANYHKYPSNSNTEYNILLKHSVSRLHERVQTFVKEQKELQQHIEQTHSKKHRADLEENKGNGHINIRRRKDAEILVDRINEVKRKGSVRRFVNRIFKRSQSMLRIKQVDTEEQKLDLTLLGDNKDEDTEEEDNPDTQRSSNSEWCTFSDIEDPPRPRLKPFFTPLEERHETIRAHLSGSTKPKSTESVNSLQLDLTSKSSLVPVNSRSNTKEPIKRLSNKSSDKNEPTKSVYTEIPDPDHRESTFEHFLKSTGRCQRFRTWFKRLCCCCSQNVEDNEQFCS